MRLLSTVACGLALALAACGTPDGYYDANGNWIPTVHSRTSQRNAAPDPYAAHPIHQDARPWVYDRRGYYDYQGYYLEDFSDFTIPVKMFPARGMCRVWFTDRTPQYQPRVESCRGIEERVPNGAYVIYGG